MEALKLRIRTVREGLSGASQPRSAEAVADHVSSTSTPDRSRPLARLYALPVVGYAARIAASCLNLPRIVQNLSRHYTAYHSEIRRLNLHVIELKHQADLAERAVAEMTAHVASLQQRLDRLEGAAAVPADVRDEADHDREGLRLSADPTRTGALG